MNFCPIGYALVIDTEMTRYSTKIYAIHIHLHRCLANFSAVTVLLFFRRVFAFAQITLVTLASRRKLPDFVLLDFSSTFGTFHAPILPII